MLVCCYGSAQPKRVLVPKKKKKRKEKRKKTDYRRVISNQQGMIFFSVSCDMYCLENNQSRVAFVLGYVHTT